MGERGRKGANGDGRGEHGLVGARRPSRTSRQHLADERRYKDEDNDEATLSTDTPPAQEPQDGQRDARLETAIIAYFHRLSKKIFEVSAEVVDFGESGDDSGPEDAVKMDREALRSMGLDAWSVNATTGNTSRSSSGFGFGETSGSIRWRLNAVGFAYANSTTIAR